MNMFVKIFVLLTLTFGTLNAGKFLMPNEAFAPYAKVNDKMQIEAGVKLGKKIYLYDKSLKISLEGSKDFTIKNIQKPKTVNHEGDAVYMHSPNFVLTLKNKDGVSGIKDVKVKIAYQGCSEEGLCYEPNSKVFTLKIDTEKLASGGKIVQQSQTDSIAQTIKSSSFIVVLLTFLGFGLLLSLTPCVFPMIPIISGVIISQGEGLTTKKAFVLSLVYVLAMAVAYTIAGVLAGLFGSNLQAALQTPWVVYSFAGVFVLLAFSMFGFYELKLPDALVAKVSSNSKRSGYAGVAIMGFLSALIVGPCVAAPLAGALVYIGQTGDALLGGAALFSMSIGMGLPLIVVGVSAGKFMPKPGAWMTLVNAVFGVLMLGVSIWMLGKVVDENVTTLLYALVGIGFALYLDAFSKEGHIFKRSVAFILLTYSLALFISVLAGAPSMSKPLGFLKASSVQGVAAVSSKELHFIKVTSIPELNAVLEKNRGKKIMLDFAADWCTSCKELDEVTFADADVRKKLSDFVLIRADVTKNGENEKALSKKYGVFGPPAIIFFDKDLQPIESKTIIGYEDPKEFLGHLRSL
ncbi:protein-disulfide reductase DsbD [Sulfurimonas sp.]|uniref:protein-disulfide reductase DsbD n=1 Tax=Sulfurimonas sp. TaxID=2022749 RepID=UPI0026245304|nr:protein-disulfide reductase DsbD [Sulfurimonas sp.]